MWLRMACVGIALLCGAGGAAAGDIEDLARNAETMLQSGKGPEAVEQLRRALRLANDRSPLAFRRAFFVSEAPKGFGIYKVRGDDVFKTGEPLIAYAEPIGMGWEQQDGGMFHSLLAVDFEIRSPAGEILTGKRDFGHFEFVSHEQNTEVMTHLTLNLTGAPAGKYVLGVIYRDKISGKNASVDLPFEIEKRPWNFPPRYRAFQRISTIFTAPACRMSSSAKARPSAFRGA